MSEFFKLQDIDRKLHDWTTRISYLTINPTNLNVEQEKVMKDGDYNPQFEYAPLLFDPDKMREELDAINEHESVLGEVFNAKRNEFLDKIDMLVNRGNKRFSIYSKKAYGFPSESTLRKAAEMLNLESDKEEKTITAKKALGIIGSELIHYGFRYELSEKEMSATASVLATSRKLFLRQGYMFSPNYVKRIIIHEIGTHVLRAENGRLQPFMLFVQGFPNYLVTEEGLAVWNEEKFGLLSKETLRNYAARALAVRMAKTESFAKIYNHLRQYFSDSWAFRLTARVKRGLGDTAQPGGATRDYSYLEGYMKVKEYLKEDTKEKMMKMYTGKVSLEYVDKVFDMHGIKPPRYLPENQSFKNLLSF
ncbi:tyrosine/phenylalanine carboxypeptidase domain-containing protein [Nanoarchaeota archaeon]